MSDDITLSLIYSAADLTVIPSKARQPSHTESGTSWTPSRVEFDEVVFLTPVRDRETGYLAKAFDTDDCGFGKFPGSWPMRVAMRASLSLRANARCGCGRPR